MRTQKTYSMKLQLWQRLITMEGKIIIRGKKTIILRKKIKEKVQDGNYKKDFSADAKILVAIDASVNLQNH